MIRSALYFLPLLPALCYVAGRGLCARRRRGLTFAANIGEGWHDDGKMAFYPDAAIPVRYSLVKAGSDGSHIAVAGVGDMPLGVCTDSSDLEIADYSKQLSVNLFGAVRGTQRGIAAGAIPAWSLLVPAANGQVQALPGTTGTYWVFGRYVGKVASTNNNVEYVPCFPRQVSVP